MKSLKSFHPHQKSGGLFSSSTHIPSPHSAQHIQLQKKLFKIDGIPAEEKKLPQGTRLIGLNITTPVEPRFLGTVPVYNPSILNALSNDEKKGWLELAKEYYAHIADYDLLCDIVCISTLSANGLPVYYIDPCLLEPKTYTPVEEMLNNFTSFSQTGP